MDKIDFIRFGGDELPEIPLSEAGMVVVPLCYENAVSYGTGTAQGPLHLLDASTQLESMDEEALVDWGRFPIHTMEPFTPSGDPETAVGQMADLAAKVMEKGKFFLGLGGDHGISIGPITAASRIFENLGVLQIDAHLDLRDSWNGSPWNHACVMRRVVDDLSLPCAQVGIRSFSPGEGELIRKRGMKPFFAHQIDPLDASWMEAVVDSLPEKVYITLDLDGLDPSVLPGTGTPEPGGLAYRQVTGLLRLVGEKRTVVAADINELSKIPGTHVSEFTAARLAAKILVMCAGKEHRTPQS